MRFDGSIDHVRVTSFYCIVSYHISYHDRSSTHMDTLPARDQEASFDLCMAFHLLLMPPADADAADDC